MNKEYPVFRKPKDENAKIWRYMDFTKLVSVVSKGALHFTRMDLLDDAFEGSVPKAFRSVITASEYKTYFGALEIKDAGMDFKELRKAEQAINDVSSKKIKGDRKLAFINSWHVNEAESVAMWRIYLKSAEGIALQSTFKRLSDSFIEKGDVHFGMINYVDDYDKEKIDNFESLLFGHLWFPYMFKRKCFEYEKELRAVVLFEPNTGKAMKQCLTKRGIIGMPEWLDVPVDLHVLVEKIYVSPTAGRWFVELVKSVVKKYGLNLEVVLSPLADKPTF